ncbi:MAG: cyoD [Candidatus Saccharibacteria bacterium]|nr:cyoD [Candidatus Saccharibacteria bacterium]
MSIKNPKGEGDATKSYFIGFFLSLLFTAVPYYLVTSKTVSGTALLATIVSIAVIQMAIQVFFFLHLGRGPKPLYNVVFFAGTVGLILVVVIGSIFIMNNLHYNMAPADVTTKLAQDESIAQVSGTSTGACQEVYKNYQVIFTDGKMSPHSINAHLCDTLTFVNKDSSAHIVVFGTYPQDASYSGEADLNVNKSVPQTITLNQLGSYQFYDQLDRQTTGDFTVSP